MQISAIDILLVASLYLALSLAIMVLFVMIVDSFGDDVDIPKWAVIPVIPIIPTLILFLVIVTIAESNFPSWAKDQFWAKVDLAHRPLYVAFSFNRQKCLHKTCVTSFGARERFSKEGYKTHMWENHGLLV